MKGKKSSQTTPTTTATITPTEFSYQEVEIICTAEIADIFYVISREKNEGEREREIDSKELRRTLEGLIEHVS